MHENNTYAFVPAKYRTYYLLFLLALSCSVVNVSTRRTEDMTWSEIRQSNVSRHERIVCWDSAEIHHGWRLGSQCSGGRYAQRCMSVVLPVISFWNEIFVRDVSVCRKIWRRQDLASWRPWALHLFSESNTRIGIHVSSPFCLETFRLTAYVTIVLDSTWSCYNLPRSRLDWSLTSQITNSELSATARNGMTCDPKNCFVALDVARILTPAFEMFECWILLEW